MSSRFCLRCSHSWLARKYTPPIQCPRCHSPYWQLPRKSKTQATTGEYENSGGGRCTNPLCWRLGECVCEVPVNNLCAGEDGFSVMPGEHGNSPA